jgi:hypothetical protein
MESPALGTHLSNSINVPWTQLAYITLPVFEARELNGFHVFLEEVCAASVSEDSVKVGCIALSQAEVPSLSDMEIMHEGIKVGFWEQRSSAVSPWLFMGLDVQTFCCEISRV